MTLRVLPKRLQSPAAQTQLHQQAMAARAVELAKELGLYERFVFFNFAWVPYAERANYLLESDLGISSHLDTLEARGLVRRHHGGAHRGRGARV